MKMVIPPLCSKAQTFEEIPEIDEVRRLLFNKDMINEMEKWTN